MRRSSRSARRALGLLALVVLCLFASCSILEDEFIVLDRAPPPRDAAAAADDARQ